MFLPFLPTSAGVHPLGCLGSGTSTANLLNISAEFLFSGNVILRDVGLSSRTSQATTATSLSSFINAALNRIYCSNGGFSQFWLVSSFLEHRDHEIQLFYRLTGIGVLLMVYFWRIKAAAGQDI